jgi:cobalt-zinc-cadmium efflux system outer membrane protein
VNGKSMTWWQRAIVPLALLFAVEAVAAPPERPPQTDAPPSADDSGDPEAEQFRRSTAHELRDSTATKPVADTLELGEVLSLGEVLDAVHDHDPRLKAARHQVDHADGRNLSARGGFDTQFWFEQMYEPLYGSGITRVRVDQATPLYGLTAWAAYQIGITGPQGIRPVNCSMVGLIDLNGCGRQVTATGGELFLGFTLPLLQGGWTDRRRTDIKQSKIEQKRMGDVRDATQLMLELDAATAYWHWVAAGLNMKIEQQLLELASSRNEKLLRQIELGAVDRLAGIENKRLILDRQARLVAAERNLQGAALALSMYLRDENGDPVVVGPERLPNDVPAMPPPPDYDLDSDIAQAIDQRPDRRAQERSLEQTNLELRLAKNNQYPRVELSGIFSREFGRDYSIDPAEPTPLPTEFMTWLQVSVPIPLRNARGQLQSTEAARGIIGADLRLLDNQIAIEVADAHIAVEAAYQQALLASGQVGLTVELAQAELKRFELGDGDLLLVNLRELAIADAATGEVTAVTDYFIAKAALEVAKGEGVQDVQP